MSSLENEFTAAVKDAELQVFIELIRARPSLSLAEISKLSRGRFAEILARVSVGQLIEGSVFVDEMLEGARPSFRFEAKGRPKSSATGSSSATDDLLLPNGDVNTRTPAGRRLYDERVMDVIRSSHGPLTAPEIRAAAKGTPLQVRKALARLISEQVVSFEGKARATRYMAVMS